MFYELKVCEYSKYKHIKEKRELWIRFLATYTLESPAHEVGGVDRSTQVRRLILGQEKNGSNR